MSLYSAGSPSRPGMVSSEVMYLMMAIERTAVVSFPRIWMAVLERTRASRYEILGPLGPESRGEPHPGRWTMPPSRERGVSP